MQPEEQITLKDIILKVISIGKSILKNWKLVILFGVVGGALGFLYDYKNLTEPTYKSSTQFYLETATPTNDYGGFANMFGGGGSSSGLFSGENLVTLIKSDDFIEKILLKEITIDGKKEILANFFHRKNKPKAILKDEKLIEEKVADEKAEDDKAKDEYKVLTHTDKDRYTQAEFNSLSIVKGPAIAGTALNPIEKTSFMTLDVTTFNDTLSKVYGEVFLENLREYYVDSKTSKIKNSIAKQQQVVDSLRRLSQANESTLARVKDQNQEAVFAQGKIQEDRLNRKTQMVTNLYQEQDRSLQNMKLQLYQDSPLFKITSPQRYPLSESKPSLTKSYKNGIYIGIFLSFIFIALADAIREIMKSTPSKS